MLRFEQEKKTVSSTFPNLLLEQCIHHLFQGNKDKDSIDTMVLCSFYYTMFNRIVSVCLWYDLQSSVDILCCCNSNLSQ